MKKMRFKISKEVEIEIQPVLYGQDLIEVLEIIEDCIRDGYSCGEDKTMHSDTEYIWDIV